MGINGLLKVLESIASDRHLSSYKGQRIAVDGYCWLHKAVYLLTDEILFNPNSKKYLIYLIRRLEQLLKYNITPIIIFDGDKLPIKKLEEDERANHRKEVIHKSIMLLDQGLRKEAQTKLIEGIDISPLMAYEFIQELKKRKIEYYVAPYEADAQLAYLSKINYVDCVITEDSDLIALQCKKILYKLDFENDMGKEIQYKDIKKCKEYSFEFYDDTQFLTFCILSGCDYFKIKGIGYKNAYAATKSHSSYKESLMLLRDKKDNVTHHTLVDFEKAFISFKHQVVYCPLEAKMKYMNSIESSEYEFIFKYLDDLSFLGKLYDDKVTKQIVFGEIDPITHKPLMLDPFKSTIGLPMIINSKTLRQQFNIPLGYYAYKRNDKVISKSSNKHSPLRLENGSPYMKKQRDKMPNSNDKMLQKKRERNIDLFDKEFFLDIELNMRNDVENDYNGIYKDKKKEYNEVNDHPIELESESVISIHSSDSNLNEKTTKIKKKPISIKEERHPNIKREEDDEDNDSFLELDDFNSFLKSYTEVNDKLKDGHLKTNSKIFLKDNNIVSITEEEENGKEVIKSKPIDLPITIINNASKANPISFLDQYKYNPKE